MAAHHRQASIQRLLGGLDNFNMEPGGGKIHGDTAAHCPGANHADGFDWAQRKISWQALNAPSGLCRFRDIVSGVLRCKSSHRVSLCWRLKAMLP